MLRWLGSRKPQGGNFLGLPCTMPPEKVAAHPKVSRDRLLKLIRQEPEFSDAFLVFGDVSVAEGEIALAALAYTRAFLLGSHVDRGLPVTGNPFVAYRDTFSFSVFCASAESAAWNGRRSALEGQLLAARSPLHYSWGPCSPPETRPRAAIRAFEMAPFPFMLAQVSLVESAIVMILLVGWRLSPEPPSPRRAFHVAAIAFVLAVGFCHEACNQFSTLVRLLSWNV
jgi:hypothetical protein